MTYEHTELRAFPRLSYGQPARIRIDRTTHDGQIIDLSRGGCKFLPFRLGELVAEEYGPGTAMVLISPAGEHPVRLRWATPNYSALGCVFDGTDGLPAPAAMPERRKSDARIEHVYL